MGNCDLSKTGRNKVEIVFNILAYSNKTKYLQELSRDIQAHSKTCLIPVYSESWHIQDPWYIKDPGTFGNLKYSKLWYIENPGIFKNLIYSEPWYNLEPYNIQNPGIFRIVECSAPWHIQNASIFRTLVYSKPWYNQNPVIFRTLTYLETCSQAYLQPCRTSSIERFKKITNFFLALFQISEIATLVRPVAIRQNQCSTFVNATASIKSHFSVEQKQFASENN